MMARNNVKCRISVIIMKHSGAAHNTRSLRFKKGKEIPIYVFL